MPKMPLFNGSCQPSIKKSDNIMETVILSKKFNVELGKSFNNNSCYRPKIKKKVDEILQFQMSDINFCQTRTNERNNNLGIDRQEKSDWKTEYTLTTPIYEIELFSVHFDMKFWCVKIALFAPISYSCQFSRLTAKIDALKLQLLSTDKLVWLSAMCPTFVRPSVHPYVTKGQLLK